MQLRNHVANIKIDHLLPKLTEIAEKKSFIRALMFEEMLPLINSALDNSNFCNWNIYSNELKKYVELNVYWEKNDETTWVIHS